MRITYTGADPEIEVVGGGLKYLVFRDLYIRICCLNADLMTKATYLCNRKIAWAGKRSSNPSHVSHAGDICSMEVNSAVIQGARRHDKNKFC